MKVLLAVCGGIAAYKTAEVVRLLRGAGHEVRCAMTPAATAFLGPLTLEVLSGQPVLGEEYLSATGSGVEGHIEAAGWADVVCVAPATADRLNRMAAGLADDFLGTFLLAWVGPLVAAPAMHPRMWEHPAVRQSVASLLARGATLVGPEIGPLASGESGIGRMSEPAAIVAAIGAAGRRDLTGVRVLVSAGPTHEPLDPVRYLGNRSSGRMGFAIAAAAARRGASVRLVAGPVGLASPAAVDRRDVVTALEMEQEMLAAAAEADLVVMTAAVADFRPETVAPAKIKKAAGLAAVPLVANPDILAQLRGVAPDAVIVGFAAETGELEAEARRKLEQKRVDFVVANDVSRSDVGFSSPDNEVVVVRAGAPTISFPQMSKERLGERLLDLFAGSLRRQSEDGRVAD